MPFTIALFWGGVVPLCSFSMGKLIFLQNNPGNSIPFLMFYFSSRSLGDCRSQCSTGTLLSGTHALHGSELLEQRKTIIKHALWPFPVMEQERVESRKHGRSPKMKIKATTDDIFFGAAANSWIAEQLYTGVLGLSVSLPGTSQPFLLASWVKCLLLSCSSSKTMKQNGFCMMQSSCSKGFQPCQSSSRSSFTTHQKSPHHAE